MPVMKDNTRGILQGPTGPYVVRMPATDHGGVFDAATTVVGNRVALNGSYCKNISADTFSADMRIPFVPVITVAALAQTCTLRIDGLDQFGRVASDVLVKLANNQTDGCGRVAFSRIDSVTVLAASVPSARLRLGMNYSNRAEVGGDLATMVITLTQLGTTRKIPLPFLAKSTTDCQVKFLGTEPNVSQLIIKTPPDSVLTFSATDVDSAGAWDLSGVAVGDVLYTMDGFIGIATTVDDANDNVAVAGGWFKEGVAGTPVSPAVAAATSIPWVHVVRHAISPYKTGVTGGTSTYSATLGGLLPGAKVLPRVGTGAVRAGVDIGGIDVVSNTFGFLPSLASESPYDLLFELFINPRASTL